MNISFSAQWFIANAIGLCTGFVVVLQTGFLLQFGFDFEAHWAPRALGQGVWLGYRFIGLLLGGGLFAAIQALALGPRLPRVVPWIVAGALGYGLVAVVMWPFWAAGLWGNIPGPIEPLVITIGGGSLMGLIQWWYLRSNTATATPWLVWWLVGLLAGVPATFLVFFILMGVLKLGLPWPSQVALSGLVIGAVAGLVSARATQRLSFTAQPKAHAAT